MEEAAFGADKFAFAGNQPVAAIIAIFPVIASLEIGIALFAMN
ncbi:MAG: hypothetical protein P8184_10650 [Calditrichia bacterium]